MNQAAASPNENVLQTVAVTGSSGFVGKKLVSHFRDEGRTVVAVRRIPNCYDFDANGLVADAVVHLAGENIAAGRWSEKRKTRILASRVEGTQNLCRRLLALPSPPKVFISASAVGFYGNQNDEALDENSGVGRGFLAEVADRWEKASATLEERGMRVVRLRFGAILSPDGGMLRKMLLPFSLGLGGKIGDGRQYISWVSMADVLGVVSHAIDNASLAGPVNVTAPQPVRNAEFATTLGEVLHRPAIFPMPAFLVKTLFGELGQELLLSGANVLPTRLLETGYAFRDPELKTALQRLLAGKNSATAN